MSRKPLEQVIGALQIASELAVPSAEPDLLLRLAYLALDRNRPAQALRYAHEATVGHACFGNREGQGRGFQALGMFRYYAKEYQRALLDFDAALGYLTEFPELQLATHQVAALCHSGMGAHEAAQQRAAEARALAQQAPVWMQGKLSWLDARLTYGKTRLSHLRAAKKILCPTRPVDCALLTVELIEATLDHDHRADVEEDVMGLCALLEKTGNPIFEKAIVRLVRHRSRLTPRLVAEIRRSLDRARDRRLSTLVTADLSG